MKHTETELLAKAVNNVFSTHSHVRGRASSRRIYSLRYNGASPSPSPSQADGATLDRCLRLELRVYCAQRVDQRLSTWLVMLLLKGVPQWRARLILFVRSEVWRVDVRSRGDQCVRNGVLPVVHGQQQRARAIHSACRVQIRAPFDEHLRESASATLGVRPERRAAHRVCNPDIRTQGDQSLHGGLVAAVHC
eukprot:scaffold18939_cov69-Phaeocystis_antarctica.AAC.3